MFIIPFCVIGMLYYTHIFLKWNEARHGTIILDPILQQLPTYDLSMYISNLEIFSGVFTSYYILCENGWQRFEYFWFQFLLISMVKMVSLFVTPLDPPKRIFPLKDIILDTFMKSNKTPIIKDLLFSGHTSFMILCLLEGNPIYIYFYIISLLIMSVMLLINKVHYTIDIIMAPFVTYTIHKLCLEYGIGYVYSVDNYLVNIAWRFNNNYLF